MLLIVNCVNVKALNKIKQNDLIFVLALILGRTNISILILRVCCKYILRIIPVFRKSWKSCH